MQPLEILKAMFEKQFDAAPLETDEMANELGASPRRMIRLRNGDTSAVGVVYAVREENRAFLGFSKHFRRLGLPVPEIYAADIDRNVYLEEDLGDMTLFDFLAGRRSGGTIEARVLDVYRQVVSWLPSFQVVAARDLDYGLCYPRASFDRQSIVWDLNYFKYCFLKPAGIGFDEQALEDDFRSLTDFLLSADRDYFLYRDFQSRNIMLRDGTPYFIDYQGGRRGALQYDVASLLYDAKADLPPAVREEMLDAYLDVLCPLVDLDRTRFMKHYYAYVYVRILQAMGAYGFRGLIEGKRLFVESIPYAVRNLQWLTANVDPGLPMPELMKTFERMTEAEGLRCP